MNQRFVLEGMAPEVVEAPGLVLNAVTVDDGVPVVTATQFRNWVGNWKRNDPNGTWDPDGVVVTNQALFYRDEAGAAWFPFVGMVDGAARYKLSNWPWKVVA